MITFIHTADIHFGMENYGKIDPKTGIHTRLLDFEKALNVCIDYAIEHNVDFFLFSGDAYKTTNPSPTQQRLLLRCFLRLFKAGIPLISIIGNHDNPISFGKSNTLDFLGDLPLDGFHVIAKPQLIKLTTKNGPVNIVGIPWPHRNNITLQQQSVYHSAQELTNHIAQSVSGIIKHLADQCDPAIPSVLAGHLTVSSGVFSGSEKRAVYGTDPLFLPSQLAIEPFDYVALGHLHRYQNLNPNGYPAIIYSGSIERIDFGERKEEKGFCVVNLERKKTSHEFITVPTRPFLHIEIQLKPGIDQTQQIIEQLSAHPIAGSIIKIVYYLPVGKKDTVDLAAIQRACSSAMHIVSILGIKEPETREKRAALKVDMDLQTLLTTFFEQKKDLQPHKERLIKKALDLHDELVGHEFDETEKMP